MPLIFMLRKSTKIENFLQVNSITNKNFSQIITNNSHTSKNLSKNRFLIFKDKISSSRIVMIEKKNNIEGDNREL